ncbi:MAG TPA: dethiobiotin synthase [Solirubrobacteraceae bacterium]|nr:dethiobiotin synthase [Solirubrobacteraceae bacterium]
MPGLFVTGTDTGAGKTVVAAAVVAALRAQSVPARALKPLITGLEEPQDPVWPSDDRLLAEVSDMEPDKVTLRRYGPAVSPHLAAELALDSLEGADLVAEILARLAGDDVLIVEGAGGLLVPICPGYDMRSLARDVGLPVLIAARPGLGTINHTLLTLEAARTGGLHVAGVVLTPWPAVAGVIERSNRQTIARLGAVGVSVLPTIARPSVHALAKAGAGLPLAEWLDPLEWPPRTGRGQRVAPSGGTRQPALRIA